MERETVGGYASSSNNVVKALLEASYVAGSSPRPNCQCAPTVTHFRKCPSPPLSAAIAVARSPRSRRKRPAWAHPSAPSTRARFRRRRGWNLPPVRPPQARYAGGATAGAATAAQPCGQLCSGQQQRCRTEKESGREEGAPAPQHPSPTHVRARARAAAGATDSTLGEDLERFRALERKITELQGLQVRWLAAVLAIARPHLQDIGRGGRGSLRGRLWCGRYLADTPGGHCARSR